MGTDTAIVWSSLSRVVVEIGAPPLTNTSRMPAPRRTRAVTVTTTRNLSYITPNLCRDGHDAPCVDGQPGGGLISADAGCVNGCR